MNPVANPENLTASTPFIEVAKALGYSTVTPDASLLVQGGAQSVESLDQVVAVMTVQEKSFRFLNGLRSTQAGQVQDFWIQKDSIGGRDGDAVSDEDGAAVDGTGNWKRQYLRLKFFAAQGGINQNLLKSPAFKGSLAEQDVDALRRIRRTIAGQVWHGNAGIIDNEFDGFDTIIGDTSRSNWDGAHVADLAGNGYSGLDANGYSNPGDIETAVNNLAAIVYRPDNGNGSLSHAWMSVNVRNTVNKFKNFENRVLLDGSKKGIVQGSVIEGFANPFTNSQVTQLEHDNFIHQDFRSAQARTAHDAAQPAPQTLTAAAAAEAGGRFTTTWAGNYRYWVAAVGYVQGKGVVESAVTGLAAAVVVAAGDKVTLTITASTTSWETGYAVFRSRKGGLNDQTDARLIERVAKAGATTTYTDKNLKLPGASTVFLLNQDDPEAFDWRKLYDPFRVELPRDKAKMAIIPFGCLTAGALRAKLPRSLAKISNFIDQSSGWSPLA